MGIVTEGEGYSYAKWLIRKKMRQVVGKYGIKESESQDIEQDLWLRLLQREPSYDPEKGEPTTFIAMVTETSVASIIDHREAQKRDWRVPVISLDEEIEHDGGASLSRHEIVDQDTYLLRTGQSTKSREELQDLRIDIDRAIRSLPPLLRPIADLLEEFSISEIARMTGIPRTTINEKRDQICQIFEKAGLGKKVSKSSVNSSSRLVGNE